MKLIVVALSVSSILALSTGCAIDSAANEADTADLEVADDALTAADWVGSYVSVRPSTDRPSYPFAHERLDIKADGTYVYYGYLTETDEAQDPAQVALPNTTGTWKKAFLRGNQIKLEQDRLVHLQVFLPNYVGSVRISKTATGVLRAGGSGGNVCGQGCSKL